MTDIDEINPEDRDNVYTRGEVIHGDKIEGDNYAIGQIHSQAVAVGKDARVEIINYNEIIVRPDSIEDLPPAPGKAPFKGLAYFSEGDADNFFGREKLSRQLVARLQSTHFLAVIGASGSGKSSLIRAGIVPHLREKNWLINIMTPSAHPLEQLATTLTRDDLSLTAADSLSKELAANSRKLHLAGNKLASRQHASHLLLVVDQFEELFTLCQDEAERQAFLDNLVTAYETQGAVKVLIGLRADFYHHCLRYEMLRTILAKNQEPIGPMKQDDLVRVIAEPAKRGGWQFVEGLVEQFLEDVGQEPGRLPLLSHALLETWKRRRGIILTLGGYREAGGVEQAIAKTADETMELLSDSQARLAKNIFLALTEIGDGDLFTRRIVSFNELVEISDNKDELDVTLDKLAHARLITVDDSQIEVAHEALLRRWPRLLRWLKENREQLLIERKLRQDVAEWDSHNRDPNFLYRGIRLKEALELEAGTNIKSGSKAEEFLRLSRKRYKRQQLVSRTLRAFVLLILVVVGIIVIREIRQLGSEWEAVNNHPEDSFASMALVNLNKPFLCVGTGSQGIHCNASRDDVKYVYNDGGWSPAYESGLEAVTTTPVQGFLWSLLGASQSDRSRAVDFVKADQANPGDLYALDTKLNGFILNRSTSLELQPITNNLAIEHCIENNNRQNNKFDVYDAIVVIACFDDPSKQSYLHIGQVDEGGWGWTTFTSPDNLPGRVVYGVHVGQNDGKVYIGTENGLFRIDPKALERWEKLLDLPYIRFIKPNPLSTDSFFLVTYNLVLKKGSIQQWQVGIPTTMPVLEEYAHRPLSMTVVPDSVKGWYMFMLLENGDVIAINSDNAPRIIDHYPSNSVWGGAKSILALESSGTEQPILFLGHTDGLFELK